MDEVEDIAMFSVDYKALSLLSFFFNFCFSLINSPKKKLKIKNISGKNLLLLKDLLEWNKKCIIFFIEINKIRGKKVVNLYTQFTNALLGKKTS